MCLLRLLLRFLWQTGSQNSYVICPPHDIWLAFISDPLESRKQMGKNNTKKKEHALSK